MKVASAALVASLMLLSSPLLAAENAPGVTDTEIKLGSTFPLSGPASAFANTGRGLLVYIDALNERGGVGGRKSGRSPPISGSESS